MKRFLTLLCVVLTTMNMAAKNETAMMTNPVIYADVPDMDIIRVGDTYYMVSTTMHFSPGCGIMKSKDLVNWEIINYAYDEIDKGDKFRLLNGQSDYSQGSWAANLRYDHYEKMFYMIMTCNTTGKTYFYVTDDIEHGKWHCSTTDKCYDPGLLFEDTGTEIKKYVLHPADTFADHSMFLREISVDEDWNVTVGQRHKVIDYAQLENPARGLRAEGYHGYKIGDYYYIFMIQGCDGQRQEIVWRSKSLFDGQWEGRMVFGGEMVDEQGNVMMQTNGIGQGGVVETSDGQWWCFLFKDYGSVGRMPIWLPMTWSEDGWPIVGNGTTDKLPAGRNMTTPYRVDLPASKGMNIVQSDEFDIWQPIKSNSRFGSWKPGLKLCWQWNHIPDNSSWSLTERKGWLRLKTISLAHNIRDARNSLTQRTFGPTCSGQTLMDASKMKDGDWAGMASFQRRYGFVGVKKENGQLHLVMHRAMDRDDANGQDIETRPLDQTKVWLRVDHDFRNLIDKATFFYSLDGKQWNSIGDTLQMAYDIPDFCGQRFMLFNFATKEAGGIADFDWFHVQCLQAQNNRFCIAKDGKAATIVVDEQDWKGVIRAANDLGDDVRKVCGTACPVVSGNTDSNNIIVGTIGKSRLIDNLIKQKKLDVSQVKGQWESFVIDVVDGNLIVAGSDKRGTIYGIYEISQRIGVSPWYWWADVPVKHQNEVCWDGGRFVQPSPKVKYRGIFINDEWPSFGGWATEHFGGVNSKMYAHMFELLLRLKANYLWPAMWDSRFNEDDPLTPQVADEYGIVMGTSHHEPMMRAHKEYVYRKDSVGPWDYSINKERLDQFFLEGMQRNKGYDNLVTIGMRGDGDVAMGKGDDTDNMKTLRKVIKGQRQIIKKVYGREDAVPQLWAIFTEVQRYYDAGFTVPDDVTLLLCDNNWGYIRRIGRDFERKRKGGLGLYYHVDMNGGPWNDRWVNTTTISKLREQLNLAYQTGIDRIWIINVGDLKPKEVPIDFIMHYAWNPEAVKAGDEQAWLEQFTANAFGKEYAKETADLIAKYSKYNLWRKAEAQVPGIFNCEEMAYTDSLWLSLSTRAEALRTKIPAEAQDAFYQLVYYPTVASAGLALLYNAATRGNSNLVQQLMAHDQQLSDYYHQIAGGKWSKMMQDKHIGYTQWFMPEKNIDPTTLGFDVSHVVGEQQPTKEYSIPAYQYSHKADGKDASWIFLPDLGRGKGCMGSSNVLAQNSGAILEYDIDLTAEGKVAIGILPTQDIMPARGLRIGVQIDDLPMQEIDARRGIVDTFSEYNPQNLSRTKVLKPLPQRSQLALSGFWKGKQLPRRDEVFDNLRWLDATFSGLMPGRHTLKVIMIDPEIVVEQIVVNPDNNHYSYFGHAQTSTSYEH